MDTVSLYRRPLPDGQIAFASAEGRTLFREALDAGTVEGFFPLIQQFHTQADPAFCGLASLVVALNTLGVDPGRLWRGPWRWFSEELLDCCSPLDQVRKIGVSLAELACLARCNGAEASLAHPDTQDAGALRRIVESASRSAADPILIASYSRSSLGQTGSGHFSPIGGYHADRDLVLLLDVARFKYPPHWVKLEDLHRAMLEQDPVSGSARGWLTLTRPSTPSNVAQFVSCREGFGIGATLRRVVAETRSALGAARPTTIEAALRVAAAAAVANGLPASLELRPPQTAEQQPLFAALERAFIGSVAYRSVREHAGSEHAEVVAAWLLAAPSELWAALPPELGARVLALLDLASLDPALAAEALLVRSQVEFLLARVPRPTACEPC